MARTPKPKPLTEKQRPIVEAKWEAAIASPQNWRHDLASIKADELGFNGLYHYKERPTLPGIEAVFAAWGLSTDGRTPLPQFA